MGNLICTVLETVFQSCFSVNRVFKFNPMFEFVYFDVVRKENFDRSRQD